MQIVRSMMAVWHILNGTWKSQMETRGGLFSMRSDNWGPLWGRLMPAWLRGSMFWGIIFAISLPLSWSCQNALRTHQERDARMAIDSLIQSGESASPTNYFQQISKFWDRACDIIRCPPNPTLTVTTNWETRPGGSAAVNLDSVPPSPGVPVPLSFHQTVPKTFALTVNSKFAVSYEDLGGAGRKECVSYLSVLVWMCGHRIKDVAELRVNLHDADLRGVAADYRAVLIPDASFAGNWKAPEDSALTDLVKQTMVVVVDTASGKRWDLQLK